VGIQTPFRGRIDPPQAEVRSRRQLLAALVASCEKAVFTVSFGGAIMSWSEGAERLYGHGTREAVGAHVDMLAPATRRGELASLVGRMGRGEPAANLDTFHVRKDGQSFVVSLECSPMRDEAGRTLGVCVVAGANALRREAEVELDEFLQLFEKRYLHIVETTSEGVWMLDADDNTTFMNERLLSMLGYDISEVVGVPVINFMSDAFSMTPRPARKRHGRTGDQIDVHLRRRDGEIVHVSLETAPFQDDEGRFAGALGMVRDVREQDSAEAALRASEERVRQAQKLEAIGMLAGGMAHDFNNLLSVILSYTSLVLEELPPEEPLRADIEEVRKAGERAAALTHQLLAFSRRQVLKPSVLALDSIVGGMESMLARLLGEDISLSVITPPGLGSVEADRGQLEQVIMNLAVNARDAMPTGGQLTIELANVDVDERHDAAHDGAAAGPHVMLSVTDTGMGMSAATREHVFEPFFTTKGQGKGTGLGMATVFGVVSQSGGSIEVESEPGRGSTFRILLPRSDRAPTATPAAPEQTRPVGNETVLLVEDQTAVRVLARNILQKGGYRVLDAQNAGEALLICEQHPHTIEMMLTDVIMPRTNGRQLAERVAPLRPAMKILFMSGYTDDVGLREGVLAGGLAFLQKPFTPADLLRKIREVLDADSGS
jgi:two-component system, cell cycle sensor histidine kinase and response regulator CckA